MLEQDGADPFRFAPEGSLAKELSASGLREVEESQQHLPWTWPGDAEEVFEYACSISAPFRPLLDRVSPTDWPAIRAEAKSAIERYRVGDEIRFGVDLIFASGKA